MGWKLLCVMYDECKNWPLTRICVHRGSGELVTSQEAEASSSPQQTSTIFTSGVGTISTCPEGACSLSTFVNARLIIIIIIIVERVSKARCFPKLPWSSLRT